MSKTVFRSRHSYLQVSHEEIFHVGVVHAPFADGGRWIGSQAEWDYLQSLPDPDMVNKSYTFMEGEDHNELTLEREDAIAGMRAYITAKNDNLIVELDAEGNEPADPEGTPFVSDTPARVLYPSQYMDKTPAEGKTFRFNMGADRNQYITTDAEEIKTLRQYVKDHANCGIKDPTYVPPTF